MAPLALDERQVRQRRRAFIVVEVRNRLAQIGLGGHKVRVEENKKLGRRLLAALFQGARLVSLPVDAPPHVAVNPPLRSHTFCTRVYTPSHLLVCTVIQNLNLELFTRPIYATCGLDDSLAHFVLVVHGQLHAAMRSISALRNLGVLLDVGISIAVNHHKAEALHKSKHEEKQNKVIRNVANPRENPPIECA